LSFTVVENVGCVYIHLQKETAVFD